MTSRTIDGFVVRATTEPEEDGADFYEPAYRIRKIDSDIEHKDTWFAVSQNTESRTKGEALEMAETELRQITKIVFHGEDWQLHFK
ncbi:hypothetical protein [Lysobacter sp. 1R34A]|uniref:hypothetical protein n=1 Tax=Lysobacter sp. 1R34A TaxID=3445786 RepID=UPI003EEE08EC